MHRAISTLEQKVDWLLQHRHFLIGKQNNKLIVLAMKKDGLVAKSTYWPDIKTGIDEAVKHAKAKWYAQHNGREINTFDA